MPTTEEFREYLKADTRPGETYELWRQRVSGERQAAPEQPKPEPAPAQVEEQQPVEPEPEQPQSSMSAEDALRRRSVQAAGTEALKPASYIGYVERAFSQIGEDVSRGSVKDVALDLAGAGNVARLFKDATDPEDIEKLARANANDPRLNTVQAQAILRDMVRRDFGVEVPPSAALGAWKTLSAAPKQEVQAAIDGALTLTPGVLPALQEYTKQAGKGEGLEVPKITLLDGREAVNVAKMRADLARFYEAKAVSRESATLTPQRRREIREAARDVAGKMVHDFVAANRESSILFADTDPDGTTYRIANEGYIPGVTPLTGATIPEAVRNLPTPAAAVGGALPGTDLEMPTTINEVVAPIAAIFSPYHHEATFKGDTQQLVETEGVFGKIGYAARIAPSTVFGAWVASGGEWGSPEHVEMIRQGYDLGQSTRDVGEWWATTVFGPDGAKDHPAFTRVMGIGTVGGIMLFEPDPLSLGLLVAGKGIKLGAKGAKVARAERYHAVLDELAQMIAKEGDDVETMIAKAESLDRNVALALKAELRMDQGMATPVSNAIAAKVERARAAAKAAREAAGAAVDAERADRGRIVKEGMAKGMHDLRVEAAEMDLRSAQQLKLATEHALNRAAREAVDSARKGGGNRQLIDALRKYGEAAQVIENTYDAPMASAFLEFAKARENLIRTWDASVYEMTRQHAKRARDAVRVAERNLAAAIGAKTGVDPKAAARIAERRAKALEKLEEAAIKAEYPERMRQHAHEVLTRWRDSFRAMADEIRNTPVVPENPLPNVVRRAGDKGGVVDSGELRGALEATYGKAIVDKWLASSRHASAPVRAVLEQGGVVDLNAQDLARLYRSVDALEQFVGIEAKSSTAEAQALIDAVTSPDALRPEDFISRFEQTLKRLMASADPIARRHGNLSENGRQAARIVTELASKVKDELRAIHEQTEAEFKVLADAQARLRDAVHTGDEGLINEAKLAVREAERDLMTSTSRYLDSTEPIKLGLGHTILNSRHGETMFQRWRRVVLANVDLAASPGNPLASKEFSAVARAWLPADDLDPAIASQIQASLYNELKAGRINSSAELFAAARRITSSPHLAGKTAEKPERAVALAISGVAYGAVADDVVRFAERAVVGVVSQEDAAAATAFIQRKGKEAKGARPEEFSDLSGVYDIFVRWGVPMFEREVAKAARDATPSVRKFARYAVDDGEVVIPAGLMEDLDERMGRIVKELGPHHVQGKPALADYVSEAWGRFMRVSATSYTVGLVFPMTKHYANLIFGNFGQVVSTAGIRRAAAVTAEGMSTYIPHMPGLLPFLGPYYTAWIDKLVTKYGKTGYLTPLSNAMMNPHVAEFFSGRDGVVRIGGRTWELSELRDLAAQQGILTAHVHEGIERIVGRRVKGLEWFEKRLETLGGADNRKAIAGLIEHHQRVATFLNHLHEGKSIDEAGQLTRDAMYDWNHPVAVAETSWLAKVMPFWRYHSLSMQQTLKAFMLPLVKPDFDTFEKAMTGRTRLARTINQVQIVEEIPEWVFWSTESEEDYEEWLEARASVPWGAKQSPIMSLSRLPSGEFSYMALPSSTAIEKMGLIMSIGFGMMEALILAGEGDGKRAVQAVGEPLVEDVGGMFHPLIARGIKGAFDMVGVDTYTPGDWVNPRPGEIEILEYLAPEAIATVRGEKKIDAVTAEVLRNLVPGFGEAVRFYAATVTDDPDTQQSLTAAAGYVLRAVLGFAPKTYSPREEAGKSVSGVAREMKRETGRSGIVAGASR